MKTLYKIILSATLFFLSFGIGSAQQDSTKKELSKEDVAMILSIFDGQTLDVVIPKAEQLLLQGRDSVETAELAAKVYDYYKNSKIMGYDAAAIYFADNYFLNNKYKHPIEDEYLMMKLFAETNRLSLIGLPAPKLRLESIDGTTVTLTELGGKYKILYFYDEDCVTCKRQTPMLMKLLEGYDKLDITFIRVYVKNDRKKWGEYVQNMNKEYHLSDNIKVIDVWDPEMTNELHKTYAVISTPQLFVIDKEDIIIGRKLTPKALQEVIYLYENQPTEFDEFFDKIFLSLLSPDKSEALDTTLVNMTVDYFYEQTKNTPEQFHELFYEMYQYLKRLDYSFQKGAAYIGRKYIVGMPQMWQGVIFKEGETTKGSTLNGDFTSVEDFISQTDIAVKLFYLNPLDKPTADLKLTSIDKRAMSIYDSASEYTILFFYDMDCAACSSTIEKMKTVYDNYKDKDISIIAIYTGTNQKEWKKFVAHNGFEWTNLWDKSKKGVMFQKYDLSSIPRIYILDKNKRVLAKDINVPTLEEVLKILIPE